MQVFASKHPQDLFTENPDLVSKVYEFSHPHCENKLKRAEVLLTGLCKIQRMLNEKFDNELSTFPISDQQYRTLMFGKIVIHIPLLHVEIDNHQPQQNDNILLTISKNIDPSHGGQGARYDRISDIFDEIRTRDVVDQVLDPLLEVVTDMVEVIISAFATDIIPDMSDIIVEQDTTEEAYAFLTRGYRQIYRINPIYIDIIKMKNRKQKSWYFHVKQQRMIGARFKDYSHTIHHPAPRIDSERPRVLHAALAQLVRKVTPRFKECLAGRGSVEMRQVGTTRQTRKLVDQRLGKRKRS